MIYANIWFFADKQLSHDMNFHIMHVNITGDFKRKTFQQHPRKTSPATF